MNITTTNTAFDPSNLIQHTAHFPESGAYTVHQSGERLSNISKGLTVNLFQQKTKPAPHAFEFFTDDQMQYASGGLWYESTNEGTRIVEYDGVFNLPKEVIQMLKALGYQTEGIE